jgi:tripartite-type tricarboxylate transporter receptor subunit TctC
MLHVPYRGGGQALSDLLAGQAAAMFEPVSTAIESVRAGKLRALAVTAAARTDLLSNVPAVGEFVPGYEASGWIGIGAPRNASPEIVEKINKEINAALADPHSAIRARIADFGAVVFASSPEQLKKVIADDTEKWAKTIKFAGVKLQ